VASHVVNARGASPAAASPGTQPTLFTSLPTLVRAFQTRDRLVATVVSYLLATIAAVGCVAAVLRTARTPMAEEPTAALASADGE